MGYPVTTMYAERVVYALITLSCVMCGWCGAEHAIAVKELSVGEVAEALPNKDWIVVDARTTDAFNGWALHGIDRGGHLPGAVDFPARWLDIDITNRTERLARALRAKGIDREKQIVVYSLNDGDRTRVTDFLQGLGFRKLHHFNLHRWLRSGRPLQRYPRYRHLLPASIVQQLVAGKLPETFEAAVRVKLVEVSWGDEDASYSQGHVPGSFHVNTDDFEPPPTWKLGSPDQLTKFARKYGFQASDTVIISAADVTASYRLAIVLQYMGVHDVRVLNGGLAAWKRAGYEVESKRHPPPTAASFGAKIPQYTELIVGPDYVKAGLKSSAFVLVDTRTWAEFIGETSGYSYHDRRGRIPGSTYGQADFTGPNSLTPYRNIDGTMRNADEIVELWRAAGIHTDKELCFLCGSGWRAAEVLMFARVIGVPRASLYSDGWIGWSNDKSNPVDSGPVKVGGP